MNIVVALSMMETSPVLVDYVIIYCKVEISPGIVWYMYDRGIATRGCSGGNGSDELASRSLVEGCGQRVLPQSIHVL